RADNLDGFGTFCMPVRRAPAKDFRIDRPAINVALKRRRTDRFRNQGAASVRGFAIKQVSKRIKHGCTILTAIFTKTQARRRLKALGNVRNSFSHNVPSPQTGTADHPTSGFARSVPRPAHPPPELSSAFAILESFLRCCL